MVRSFLWGTLGALLFSIASWPATQEGIYFAAADRVSVRRMADVPPIELAPGVHVRTVVGATGSFSIGDFDPGSAAVLHHHTREQGDIGVSGEFAMTIGGRVETLRPDDGLIVPPNVAHSIANNSTARATVIEFHTVRRPDLVPPRPALTFPAAPSPTDPPPSPLIRPMTQPGREPAAPARWLRGETCLMAWRRLENGAAPVELRAGRVEHFVYVLRGELQMTSGGARQRIAAGSLVIVPAGGAISIQAGGSQSVALAEFVPAPADVEDEPHHKTVLKNEYVQAFRVTLAPGEATFQHTHRFDDAAVRLSEARVASYAPGELSGASETNVPGLVTTRNNASRPLTHRVQNVGKTVFDVLDVQMMMRPPGPAADPMEPPVAENPSMRAYRFELAPGEQLQHAHSRPYVFVAVTDTLLRTTTSGRQSGEQRFASGDLQWVATPAAHAIVNAGKAKAILVEFELK